LAGHLKQFDTHNRVIIEVWTRIITVRTDSPDSGSEMEDNISLRLNKCLPDRGSLPQVIFLTSGDENVNISTPLLQFVNNVTA
jgi:hypothetical protein